MEQSTGITPLSEKLASGIGGLYKLGGYGLTLVFVGTMLLLTGVLIDRGAGSYILAAIGTVVILAVLALFYQKEIRPIGDARRATTTNAELVDTVQLTALKMTDLAKDLQSLAFKYASEISTLVTGFQGMVRERVDTQFLRSLPGANQWVERLIDSDYTVRAADLSAAIVRTTASAEQVIGDIRIALANSDPAALRRYLGQLNELDQRVKGMLVG